MADMLAEPEDLAALLQQDLDRATTELLLQNATAAVQSAAGQRLIKVEDDELTLYLDWNDSRDWIVLPQRPVRSVASVTIGATPISDWAPQYNRHRLFRAYGWRSGSSISSGSLDEPTAVTVVYTHGYDPDDQRLQLARQATLALAASVYTNPAGVLNEAVGDVSQQFAEASTRMEISPTLAAALRRQYGRSGNSVRLTTRS